MACLLCPARHSRVAGPTRSMFAEAGEQLFDGFNTPDQSAVKFETGLVNKVPPSSRCRGRRIFTDFGIWVSPSKFENSPPDVISRAIRGI